MIPLNQYAKIYNNYCVCYFGYADEYLIQLKLLRPHLEKHFPGLNILFCCKDEKLNIFKDDPKSFGISELKSKRSSLAHVHELEFNSKGHPVENFLNNCGLKNYTVTSNLNPEPTNLCVISSQSNYPTKNLTEECISKITTFAKKQDYDVVVDGDIKAAGLVIGVENLNLFQAAASGTRTILVPTGCGTHLYKNMFPLGEIYPLAV